MGLTKPRAAQIFDLDYKQATRVITVSNVTLTGGAPAVVDGVSLTVGDRVLVTGQSTGSENGLYAVSSVGVGSDGTWVRTSDGNDDGEIQAGMIVMVTEGAIYADTQWKLTTNGTIDIGVTNLNFVINILSDVGGANTQVQINDAGVLGGFSNFVFDKTTNVLSVTGNVSGSYIIGNGSLLTGLPAGYADSDVATYLASGTVSTDIRTTAAGTFGSVIVDTITIDAAAIATSGDLTLDSAGDITLNADGADIILADDTVDFGRFKRDGGDFVIKAETADKDIIFKGVKAGSPDTVITALSLDMSNDGRATFNENIVAGGTITGSSFVGVATSAQYADLAENYLADSFYNAGTVVEFGGNTEVTISSISHSTAVAGIVSTAPAYLMNSHLEGEHVVAVALTGRVPCAVQGPVKKGTVLVSGIVPGTAMAIDSLKFEPGCVIGKSMSTIETAEIKTIEVAVGRL